MTNWLQPLFPPAPIELVIETLSTAIQNEGDEQVEVQVPGQESGNLNGSAYDNILQC